MDTAKMTIKHVKEGWKEGWLDKPESKPEQIAQMIYADISDRGGLQQELEMIDGDTKKDMLYIWAEIIREMKNSNDDIVKCPSCTSTKEGKYSKNQGNIYVNFCDVCGTRWIEFKSGTAFELVREEDING